MKSFVYTFSMLFLLACSSKESDCVQEKEIITQTVVDTVYIDTLIQKVYINEDENELDYYVNDRLPDWFVKTGILKDLKIKDHYHYDHRMNPLYLEADFNGDSILDLAIPIKDDNTEKEGIAIIHGETLEVFIVGAGYRLKEDFGDNLNWMDIWQINRLENNLGTQIDESGDISLEPTKLQLTTTSIYIAASEIGGGLIYWDGEKYSYFHQTC
ncbi:hypothetical protein K6119_09560 [Paracrocinitomix mangrovi]|uniref:hypothetical protein n=1 Tax=Paracrocinitomix mangrovi TaxID=2862509 RepID=UPI001C8F0158|nr:hypothetical protein [Paracrocinitomix mangrovi]UKN03737.1 hypothetical protein K6119_09560 [Paracrocinitomix mangrovi]